MVPDMEEATLAGLMDQALILEQFGRPRGWAAIAAPIRGLVGGVWLSARIECFRPVAR
jgi:hypothetical protein